MPAIQGDNTITVYTPFDKLAKGSALIIGDGVVQIKAEGVKASGENDEISTRCARSRRGAQKQSRICRKSHHHHFRFRTDCDPEELRIRSASVTSTEEYVRSNRARARDFQSVTASIRTLLSEALECQLTRITPSLESYSLHLSNRTQFQ